MLESVARKSTRAKTSGLRIIGPSMATTPMPSSTLRSGLDWPGCGRAAPRSRNERDAAAIERRASGWMSQSRFCRNTGFTHRRRCQRGVLIPELGITGDGLRSRYQPPPALFLFDRCVFPAALATSHWSLNPAPHGGRNCAAMISPKGRHHLPSRAWQHGSQCCCSRSTGRISNSALSRA